MRAAVSLLAVAAVSALAILLATTSEVAGSCATQVLGDQIGRADVIASGVVTAVSFGGSDVTFRPTLVYKGALAPGAVHVRTGPSTESGIFTSVHTSADYSATAGTAHTLYLRHEASGFVTDSCSGSHPGPANGLEIAALGSGRAVDSGSGPLTQLLDQLAALPPLTFLGILLILVLIAFWLRSRRRPPLTPMSGAPA
jgi:hypothetical protein